MDTTRLNPKLTKRSSMPLPLGKVQVDDGVILSHRSGTSVISDINFSSGTSVFSGSESNDNDDEEMSNAVNPKLHLMHNGTWIPKQWSAGRHIERTGVWDCCGEMEHYSMYCESLQVRMDYKARLQLEDERKEEEIVKISKRKNDLLRHISDAQQQQQVELDFILQTKLTREEDAIREACSKEGSFNAPMLVAWLLKHCDEEPTTVNGLTFLLNHLESGDGCFLMMRNGLVNAFIKIHSLHKKQASIQLLLLRGIRQLLDCNYTRSSIIQDVSILQICFSIAYSYMTSMKHVEIAGHCITQCLRNEGCIQYVLSHAIVGYMITFCQKYSKNILLIRSTLKMFAWVSTNQSRLEYVCGLSAVQTTIYCLRRHKRCCEVLGPGIVFLFHAAKHQPSSMEMILKMRASELVIGALTVMHDQAELQLEGLKLLQLISKTSVGWQQISDIDAGWQTICQGTLKGDALIHKLPGSFHNPGWSIGDTPYLPQLERLKLQATRNASTSLQSGPKATWTPFSLREFMGLSLTGQKLRINVEFHDLYFEMLSTVDMLPKLDEGREEWFVRLRQYENENEVRIEEMVSTIQEMRRRESVQAMNSKNAKGGDGRGTVKQVYVKGELVTIDSMQAKDIAIDEALDGIV